MTTTTFSTDHLTAKPKKAVVKHATVKTSTAKAKASPKKARKPTTGELLIKLSKFEWNFDAMRC